jgi:hypothetical protein
VLRLFPRVKPKRSFERDVQLHCPELVDRKTQMTSGLNATGDIRLRQKQLRKLE